MSGAGGVERARAFLESLAGMAPTPRVTFAGAAPAAGGSPGPASPAPTWVLEGLVPMTTSVALATGNFARPMLLAVAGRTGRDLAAFSDRPWEGETVYLPGSVFLTHGVVEVEGLVVTVAEEVIVGEQPERAGDLDAFLAGVVERVRAERAAPPVPVMIPGKWDLGL